MEYRRVHERSAALVTPPFKNAQRWKEKIDWANSRNDKLTTIKHLGRAIWKRWSGYHQRNLIDTAMHRFKPLGKCLHARKLAQQAAEVHVRCAIINCWTASRYARYRTLPMTPIMDRDSCKLI